MPLNMGGGAMQSAYNAYMPPMTMTNKPTTNSKPDQIIAYLGNMDLPEEGLNFTQIANHFGWSAQDTHKVLDTMVDNGALYNTCDDDHYKPC